MPKNWRLPLIVACVVSVIAHLTLIASLHVEAPERDVPVSRTLEARLVPMKPIEPAKPTANLPEPQKPEPKKSKPVVPRKQVKPVLKNAEVASLPIEDSSADVAPPVVEEIQSVEEEAPAPIEESPNKELAAKLAPETIPLPNQLLIRFAVSWGGLKAGQADYKWERQGSRYNLEAFTKTTGLVGLFKSIWVLQTSAGQITENGLQPDTYVNQYSNRASESAEFNWADNSLTLLVDNAQPRTVPLLPGTQDLISVLFQLAFAPPVENELQLAVVIGRKLDTYRFITIGEETLHLPFGVLRTLHVRRPKADTDDGLDVWLAIERHYLPVKIIRSDRKDSRPVELIASELLASTENKESINNASK
ncbi:MAG: DUF3108 domain-containing protein [Pseudomonadota bacterium]